MMMDLTNYQTNFSEEALLINNNIIVESQERDIVITIPTYQETLAHYDFNTFMSVLSVEYENLAKYKSELPFKFENRAQLVRGLTLWSAYNELIQKYMKEYIKGIEFSRLHATINSVKVTAEEFELIADILLVGLAIKSYDFGDNGAKEEDKEQEVKNDKIRRMLQKEKEVQQKVLAAKRKKAKNSGNKVTMERYIMSTIYTFGIGLKELYNCNPYTVFWYFKNVQLIDIHKVNQIAAGNGLLSGKKGSKYKGILQY